MSRNIKLVLLLSFFSGFNLLFSAFYEQYNLTDYNQNISCVLEHPTAKLLMRDKTHKSIINLETEDIFTTESFLNLMAQSFSMNKSLLIARVITEDSQKNNLVKFYNAHYFINFLFKDKFLDYLAGTYKISEDAFRDPSWAKIIYPVEIYYIDNFDSPGFEYLGEITHSGKKPEDISDSDYQNSKNVLKRFFVANLPDAPELKFNIPRQTILENKIILADLYNFGFQKPRVSPDQPKAVQLILDVIAESRQTKFMIKLSYRALLSLFKIFINTRGDLESYSNIFESIIINVANKNNPELEAALRGYHRKFLCCYHSSL